MSADEFAVPLIAPLQDKLPFLRRVAVFGGGAMGRHATTYLRRRGIEVAYIADNDPAKQGTRIEGVDVVNPYDLTRLPSLPVVIASLWAYDIRKQLSECGITDVCLFDSRLIETAERADASTAPGPDWDGANLWEAPIQIVFRDLVRPGDVAFDVGANVGGLSQVLSRLAGPRGVVCAFEASARNIPACQASLARNGCGNVQLYHLAVAESSGDVVRLFRGDNPQADSLYPSGSPAQPFEEVPSVTLDDFCATTGLTPSIVKMDIEGTELRAVRGARHLLDRARPHLVLEVRATQPEVVQYLTDVGYLGFDVASYAPVRGVRDLERRLDVCNIAFVHVDRLKDTPYAAVTVERVTQFGPAAGVSIDGPTQEVSEFVVPETGRFILALNLVASPEDTEVMVELQHDGDVRVRHVGPAPWIAKNYACLPFQGQSGMPVRATVTASTPGTQPLSCTGSTLYVVKGLSGGLPAWYR